MITGGIVVREEATVHMICLYMVQSKNRFLCKDFRYLQYSTMGFSACFSHSIVD